MNDKPKRTQPTKEKFAEALEALIDGCQSAGMHPMEFTAPLKSQLAAMRTEAMPRLEDAYSDAKQGVPVDEQELRKALELEEYEPLPEYRD